MDGFLQAKEHKFVRNFWEGLTDEQRKAIRKRMEEWVERNTVI